MIVLSSKQIVDDWEVVQEESLEYFVVGAGAGRPRVEMMTPHRAASGTDFVLCNRGLMDVAEPLRSLQLAFGIQIIL